MIPLGPTFSSFMYELGLTPITGKRGTAEEGAEEGASLLYERLDTE